MLLSLDEIVMFEALLIFGVSSLSEIVHVELAHEGREVVVLEVSWKDLLSELVGSVDDEASAIWVPENSSLINRVLQGKM